MEIVEHHALAAVLIVFIAASIGQVTVFRHVLNNAVSTPPGAWMDAYDYTARAAQLHRGNFTAAFSDGYRMPGYPAFLALFYGLGQPLLIARIAQILLASLLPVLAYFAAFKITASRRTGLIASFAFLLWAPLYAYSAVLYAEGPSEFVWIFLILIVAGVQLTSFRAGFICALLVAILTFLKPNHILLMIPVVAATVYDNRLTLRAVWKPLLACAVLITLLIAPWTLWVSRQTGQFIALTDVTGLNAWIGFDGARNPDNPEALDATARWFQLHDPATALQVAEEAYSIRNMAKKSEYFETQALRHIRAHPIGSAVYGLVKVLYTFGLTPTKATDVVILAFTLVSNTAMVQLWRQGVYRRWCVFYAFTELVAAAQAFFLLADHRFSVVALDVPGLIVVSLWLGQRSREVAGIGAEGVKQRLHSLALAKGVEASDDMRVCE